MFKTKVIVKHFPKLENYNYYVGFTGSGSKVSRCHNAVRNIPYRVTGKCDFDKDNNYGIFFFYEEDALEFAKLFYDFLIQEEINIKEAKRIEKERIAALNSKKTKILAIIPETWLSKLRVKFNV